MRRKEGGGSIRRLGEIAEVKEVCDRELEAGWTRLKRHRALK